jgi:hypothetical protein
MKRKIVLLVILVLVTLMLCGFTHKLYEYSINDFYYFVDKETGVNYVVFVNDRLVGCPSGICPRYNRDGSLYISKTK